ncbi:MAG: AAA family ATPase [Lautropia sp.]|nr:AAA family ATPase [Lautropia sp.]
MNKANNPQLWVVAGPNGAGKSTLVARHAFASQIPMVNPDEIARRIDPTRRDETAVIARAGREAVLARKALLEEGRSFGIETTLTGRGEIQLMQQARAQGYKVNLVYVGIADPMQSNTRVAFRVSRGGHDVPESDIMRRFDRSLSNLPEAIKAADRAFVLDNSARQYRLLFSLDKENVRFVSKDLPAWSKEALSKAGVSLQG